MITPRGGAVKVAADTGGRWPQAKGCGSHQELEEAGTVLP